MRILIKNKLIIITLMFIVLLSCFTSNVLGYDTVIDSETTYTFPDEIVDYLKLNASDYLSEEYYCVGFKWNGNGYYYVVFVEKAEGLVFNYSNPNNFSVNVNCNRYEFVFSSSYNFLWKSENLDKTFTSGSFGGRNDSSIGLLANGTFYNGSGSVFFQETPLTGRPETILVETQLMEIMKQEKAEVKTLQEIITILPLIIVVVVSFLGLRKALRMLENFLRRS